MRHHSNNFDAYETRLRDKTLGVSGDNSYIEGHYIEGYEFLNEKEHETVEFVRVENIRFDKY